MNKVIKIMLLFVFALVPNYVLAADVKINCPNSVMIGDSIECIITGYHTTLAGLKADVSYSGMDYVEAGNLTGSNMFVVSGSQLDGAFDIANTSKILAKYIFKANVDGTARIDVNCQQIIDGTDFSSVNCTGDSKYIQINKPQQEDKPIVPNVPSVPSVSKSSDATLKGITISSGTIEFDSSKYNYSIEVEHNIDKIEISGVLSDSNASVRLEGDTNLTVGNNVLKLNVIAEDGVTKKEYILNILRKAKQISIDSGIKDIIVDNYNLDFDKYKSEYFLTIGNEDYLSINVELEDESFKYEIIGNNNLKDGSVIMINVTSTDGNENNYVINIVKPKNLTKILSWSLFVSIVLNLFTSIFLIFVLEKLSNNKNK